MAEARTAEAHYGMLAEFKSPEALLEAARRARQRRLSAARCLHAVSGGGAARRAASCTTAASRCWDCSAACFGFAVALAMQLYINFDYPINVGGRPLYPLVAFAVVTFELTVLFARRLHGRRHAGVERAAAAELSGVRGAPLSSRLARPLLSVRRGRRSALRCGRDPTLSRDAGPGIGRAGSRMRRVLPLLILCALGRLRPGDGPAAEIHRI